MPIAAFNLHHVFHLKAAIKADFYKIKKKEKRHEVIYQRFFSTGYGC